MRLKLPWMLEVGERGGLFGLHLLFLLGLVFSAAITPSPVRAAGLDWKPLSELPIQEGGRVKPLDTFARESARFITGHESFEGKNSLELVLDWAIHPQVWDGKDFILIENLELKTFFQLPLDQKRVSPKFLRNSEAFIAYAKTNFAKQQKKMTLNAEEKESLALFGRLQRFLDIESGDAFTVIPIPDSKTQKWVSLGDLNRAFQKNRSSVPRAAQEVLFAFAELFKSDDAGDKAGFLLQSQNLSQILSQIGGKDYADPSKMALEVHFNQLDPFFWAWVVHLTAAILIGLSFLFKSPKAIQAFYRPGFAFFLAGVGLSLYGFVLRCLIAGRPPVSNMYESLIWVTFGMTVFALIFELIFKTRTFVLAGSILAWVGFVLADNVPTILDPSIQPIEPVLRSNFWLTIHVLTITLSYAAFLLSMGIGHVGLWTLWFHRRDKERLQRQTKLLYRVVQVGVVLLAAGTILGGVWANYSWGRFWGWDPKETWALIALLGYVAILHGRLSGWLKETGFIIGVVSAFLGVLMAWYGVNFILGVGLHSYGFSKGGLPYVITFTAAEIILVTAVGLKARKAA